MVGQSIGDGQAKYRRWSGGVSAVVRKNIGDGEPEGAPYVAIRSSATIRNAAADVKATYLADAILPKVSVIENLKNNRLGEMAVSAGAGASTR